MNPELQTGRADRPSAPLPLFIALFFLLVCINALVAKFVVFTFELAPGVSLFYIVAALMILFTLWFGLWGAGAAYLGCYIGAGLLSGIPPGVALYWSGADLIQVLIPLYAFRRAHADPGITTPHDLVLLIASGVVLNNLAGAIWGTLSLVYGEVIQVSDMGTTFFGWWIGNMIICLLILPLALKIFTPVIREHELFVTRYWK